LAPASQNALILPTLRESTLQSDSGILLRSHRCSFPQPAIPKAVLPRCEYPARGVCLQGDRRLIRSRPYFFSSEANLPYNDAASLPTVFPALPASAVNRPQLAENLSTFREFPKHGGSSEFDHEPLNGGSLDRPEGLATDRCFTRRLIRVDKKFQALPHWVIRIGEDDH